MCENITAEANVGRTMQRVAVVAELVVGGLRTIQEAEKKGESKENSTS